MAEPTNVNGAITDPVPWANVKVLTDSPTMLLSVYIRRFLNLWVYLYAAASMATNEELESDASENLVDIL